MHIHWNFGYLAAIALVALIPKIAVGKPNTQPLDLNGETAYINFIKVLAGILITTPEPPKDITNAVKVVMRDLMNDGPAKQGYFSYLTTSALRVYDSPLKIQVDNMFNIIVMMSDPTSAISKSSKIVQDFMLSPQGFTVYADIENYVINLFQPIIAAPSNGAPSAGLLDSLQRPANSARPVHRQPQ